MGYEQMGNRAPLRFLAAAMSGESNSGVKVIGKGRLPTNDPIGIALKIAASLRLSKTYLGAQFRRLGTRLGAPIAIKGMAAKLKLGFRIVQALAA
jgi:hypothetical protein